jgi:hypothetical protein
VRDQRAVLGAQGRRSVHTKTAASARPTTIPAGTHHGQPSWWPSTSGSTIKNTAGTATASPIRSSLRVALPGDRVSAGTIRAASASTAMPIGTFTRNTGRHSVPNRFALTSTPPSTWPAANPPASTAE